MPMAFEFVSRSKMNTTTELRSIISNGIPKLKSEKESMYA
jgi:hypothetical protein